MSGHPNDRRLLSYQEDNLSPGHRRRVEAHLRACLACQARLEELNETAESLTATLTAVGNKVPLAPSRSWQRVAQQRKTQRSTPLAVLLRSPLRRAATLVALVLLSGGLVAALAGLAHTVATTIQTSDDPTPTAQLTLPANPSSPPGPLPHSDGLKAPTTLLILGIDGESASSDEIDMLMLLYLDAEAERTFLLSIPRNLYVEVPSHGKARAGSVYGMGEQDEATDGLTLVREVVSTTLGIPVHHAALIRFDSFVTLVDAIDGVDVDVLQAIDDANFPDGHGGYEPLSIPAGQQHFDGALALRYARTRVVPAPGFDRTFRQRQLVLAAQERVLRLEMLPDLIAQSPTLWAAVAGGLETDLSLRGTIDLALSASSIAAEDIATADLGGCCTAEHTTPSGELVLLLQSEETEAVIQDLLEERR
ncbi:MAG: LCP family protein [Anaerolineae bacterium]|nr:LCP family protein [Anaerolineae bacterium]